MTQPFNPTDGILDPRDRPLETEDPFAEDDEYDESAFPYPRIKPTSDVIFKIIFAQHEDLLISLLTAVLEPKIPIVRAEVKNPELPKSAADDKGSILDIRVRLDNGELVDVEMQSTPRRGTHRRLLYYWARAFGSTLDKGEEYTSLSRCIGVYFFDFKVRNGKLHSIFEVRECSTGQLFDGALQLHTIELPRLQAALCETGTLENSTPLQRWARFLKSNDFSEIQALTRLDPMIQKAEQTVETASSDSALRELAEDRLRWCRAWGHEVSLWREEGLAQGRVEGRVEGWRELVVEQLNSKFGTLDQAARDRIEKASDAQLKSWALGILKANSVDELFRDA